MNKTNHLNSTTIQPTPPSPEFDAQKGTRYVRRWLPQPTLRENSKRATPGSIRNIDVALEKIKENGQNYRFAAKELQSNKDFALKALKVNFTTICQIPESLRANLPFMLEAVNQCDAIDVASICMLAAKDVQQNTEFQNAALAKDKNCIFEYTDKYTETT